ncbi:buccalin isoform X2 [Hetaerina americana]
MAVRLTLLAAPLLGVTLVLLALLPPSSHVASASAAAAPGKAPATTASPGTLPRSLPCNGQAKADQGDAGRGKRDTKCTMVAAATNADKRLKPEGEEGPHMSKRAVSESISAEKRAPSSSGFFGMRGKKGVEAEGDGGEAFKRAPSSSGFFGMRGKKEDPSDGVESTYYDPEDFESADKRAPSSSGFFGMRGKKIPILGYAPWYRDPKRARMGFFGTRGKKSGDEGEDYYGEEYKRAPAMGFFGSRGKKWDDDGSVYDWGSEDSAALPSEDKRVAQHMNFFGMRGKRNGGDVGDAAADYEKRAPNSGFFGMRGKKSPGFDGDEAGEWGEEKRAPNSGFFGMRGKKDYADEMDYDDAYGEAAASKRAPMGFFGMRGKKEYPGYWTEGGDKRAPMGFFGMRGKKDGGEEGLSEEDGLEEEKRAAQHLSFFGMRGKKSDEFAPADGWYLHQGEVKRGLAGAAVSAWPSSSQRPSSINSLLAYLAGRDAAIAEVSGHSGSGWRPVRKRFRGNKKAPMGFIGMRGKKAETLSKEVWPPSANTNGENGYEMEPKHQDGVDEEIALQNQVEVDHSGSQ